MNALRKGNLVIARLPSVIYNHQRNLLDDTHVNLHQRVEYPEDKAEEAKESVKNEIDSKPDVDSIPVVDAEVGNTLESNSEPKADKPANTKPKS